VAKPSTDRILASSERVLAEHGYNEVSLRQLMAAAGVSTTAFYARFASKEAVLDALVTRLFADLYAAAPAALDKARDLASGVELGVELLCDQFGPRRALVRMILAETGSAPGAGEARRKAYHLLAGFLADRLRRVRTTRTFDPKALAWALVGALEIQIVRWAVWEEIEIDELATQLTATARAILDPIVKEPT